MVAQKIPVAHSRQRRDFCFLSISKLIAHRQLHVIPKSVNTSIFKSIRKLSKQLFFNLPCLIGMVAMHASIIFTTMVHVA